MPKQTAEYKNNYIRENYDRVTLFVAKGKKEVLKEYGQRIGESVNAFINIAIEEKIKRMDEEDKK